MDYYSAAFQWYLFLGENEIVSECEWHCYLFPRKNIIPAYRELTWEATLCENAINIWKGQADNSWVHLLWYLTEIWQKFNK